MADTMQLEEDSLVIGVHIDDPYSEGPFSYSVNKDDSVIIQGIVPDTFTLTSSGNYYFAIPECFYFPNNSPDSINLIFKKPQEDSDTSRVTDPLQETDSISDDSLKLLSEIHPVFYPHPFSVQTVMRLYFTKSTAFSYTITDLKGNQVLIFEGQATKGEWKETIQLNGVAAGVYILKLEYDEKIITAKLIKSG